MARAFVLATASVHTCSCPVMFQATEPVNTVSSCCAPHPRDPQQTSCRLLRTMRVVRFAPTPSTCQRTAVPLGPAACCTLLAVAWVRRTQPPLMMKYLQTLPHSTLVLLHHPVSCTIASTSHGCTHWLTLLAPHAAWSGDGQCRLSTTTKTTGPPMAGMLVGRGSDSDNTVQLHLLHGSCITLPKG